MYTCKYLILCILKLSLILMSVLKNTLLYLNLTCLIIESRLIVELKNKHKRTFLDSNCS